MGWRAVTESGRVYESCGSGARVSGEGYFPNATIRVIDRDELLERMGEAEIWDYVYSQPPAPVPEEGKSLFLFTMGDAGWRLSTNIVSLEITEEEDG